LKELQQRGHRVVCLVRPSKQVPQQVNASSLCEVTQIEADVTSAASVQQALQSKTFDAVVSCMASRSGLPSDAWAIDHDAHLHVLHAARQSGVKQFVLLSAICVQKPRLAFQHAKLTFERALMDSGLMYSIVRPTAYFKSLSGQIERLRQGKPFWVFGDGRLTSCKPISDADLASYLADCLEQAPLHNRILPIGGPGVAITPLEQAQVLFKLLDRPVHVRHMPVSVLSAIVRALDILSQVFPALKDKAELARIGHYYATESMLVMNPATGRYDANLTPSHGQDTLFDFYREVIRQGQRIDLGEHAVF
jgi:divinyl chlorophyllide a 8-vinyl-reductase